jgi:hypothetical protein
MRLGFQSAMALLSYGSCGLALAGCGSRTGLEATGTLQSTSLAADGGSRGPGAVGSSAPVLCAVRAGPVATCAPTPETGTILACNSNFPSCVLPPGATYWECCNGQPRYDGPGGNCGGGSECPVVADKVHLGGASPSSETTFDCLTTPLSVPGTIVPNCRSPRGASRLAPGRRPKPPRAPNARRRVCRSPASPSRRCPASSPTTHASASSTRWPVVRWATPASECLGATGQVRAVRRAPGHGFASTARRGSPLISTCSASREDRSPEVQAETLLRRAPATCGAGVDLWPRTHLAKRTARR